MKSSRIVLLAIGLMVTGSSVTQADGWFGKSSEPAANGTTTGTQSGWSSWMPWSGKPKAPKSNKPSMLTRMTTGTKNAWNKSVSFLNPFDNPPKKPDTPKVDNGTGQWFGSSSPANGDKKISSVPDWLGQERPKF